MLMASGLNHGIRRSLPHFFGIYVGFPLMLACIGLGLGGVFLSYPVIHQVVKFAGSAYLLYLAWKIANAGRPQADENLRKPMTFLQAMAFQWVNPKAWIMTIGAISAFTRVDDYVNSLAFIILSYFLVGCATGTLWLGLGSAIKQVIQSQRALRLFNITMALLLVASIVPVLGSEIVG